MPAPITASNLGLSSVGLICEGPERLPRIYQHFLSEVKGPVSAKILTVHSFLTSFSQKKLYTGICYRDLSL